MLDVHAPGGKLDGIKDFLLHLFTMTVGLFIALFLEGCVERRHKAELRLEAETNLRQEMKENQAGMQQSRASILREEQHLKGALLFLEERKAGRTAAVDREALGFENRALSDASWRTASATGALSLMEYKDVQEIAGAYLIQEEWTRVEVQTLNDYLEMDSFVVTGFDADKFTAADAASAEPVVRHALAHLQEMRELGEALSERYNLALKVK